MNDQHKNSREVRVHAKVQVHTVTDPTSSILDGMKMSKEIDVWRKGTMCQLPSIRTNTIDLASHINYKSNRSSVSH